MCGKNSALEHAKIIVVIEFGNTKGLKIELKKEKYVRMIIQGQGW